MSNFPESKQKNIPRALKFRLWKTYYKLYDAMEKNISFFSSTKGYPIIYVPVYQYLVFVDVIESHSNIYMLYTDIPTYNYYICLYMKLVTKWIPWAFYLGLLLCIKLCPNSDSSPVYGRYIYIYLHVSYVCSYVFCLRALSSFHLTGSFFQWHISRKPLSNISWRVSNFLEK